MHQSSRPQLMERLLEHVRGERESDEPLVELIETLDRTGREDLLFLIDDFFGLRPDDVIEARVGSPAALERVLVDLHQVFRPIADAHNVARERVEDARSFYARMGGSRERKAIGAVIADRGWPIESGRRASLDRLHLLAGEWPQFPFEELNARLELVPGEDVLDLILLLRDRKNEVRRNKSRDEGRNRR